MYTYTGKTFPAKLALLQTADHWKIFDFLTQSYLFSECTVQCERDQHNFSKLIEAVGEKTHSSQWEPQTARTSLKPIRLTSCPSLEIIPQLPMENLKS